MEPFVIGLSHASAPVEVRERFALPEHALDAALSRVRSRARECVVLSTCNRFEVYSRLAREADAVRLVAALTGAEPPETRSAFYTHRGRGAVRHLFRVAAGAESMVPGEAEVLGQVRRAWQAAQRVGCSGPVLSQLFLRAVSLGKRVRAESTFAHRPASVSSAAVHLARRVVGHELRGCRVVVVGSGTMGDGVVRCLFECGAIPTVVAHREVERARDLALRYDGQLVAWDGLADQLVGADIAISCTAAPHFVLRREVLERVVTARSGRPLCLIDLAVPRDIEPSIATLPGIRLHDIDDLRAVVESTISRRRAELPRIETLIEAELQRFDEWFAARAVAPAIRDLRAESDRIVESETARALARFPDASPADRRMVETLAARIAGRLLHAHIQRLKTAAGDLTAARPPGVRPAVAPPHDGLRRADP